VGINSRIHWRFDENMARLSLLPDPQSGVGLFWNNSFTPTDIFLVRQEPMPPSTQISDSAAAGRDYSGNTVAGPASTTFTTAPTADFDPPKLIDSSPANSATGVPVNAVLRAYLDGPLDPASILAGGVALRDGSTSGATVPATVGLEADGSIVTIVPSQPLQTNHTYAATAVNLFDASGNQFATASLFQFTTGSVTDTQAPAITSTSVQDGQLGVQTNANLQVTFSEPVNTGALGGIVLRLGGIAVPATFNVSADHRTITLKLVQPLTANTTYTFSVGGVMDLSGNVLATPATFTFTTAAGAHL
jgi:hypothetical protein